MIKVYKLKQDLENFAHFIDQWDKLEDSFSSQYWGLKTIDLNAFKPLKLKLYASDTGKKNYQTDISFITGGLFIFSEKAINIFKEILDKTGQIIPIETESKKKNFYGFFPNKNIYDDSIINLDKSVWRQAEKGKIITKLVLNHNYPQNDFLFTLCDSPSICLVTDKFKELVENHDLKGFDFSKEIEISN